MSQVPPPPASRRALQDELVPVVGSAREARLIVDEVAPSGPSLDDAAIRRARSMASRRRGGEPLQYILGRWAFRTLEVQVDERVLIPRPETEVVAEVALAELAWVAGTAGRDHLVAADLGTGSGVLALSLAREGAASVGHVVVWAVDDDADALDVAYDNLELLGRSDPDAAVRVVLQQGSWWSALPRDAQGSFDLVVSNPPYVSEEEWALLDPVVRHEPQHALVAGPGSDGTPGLAAVETVLSEAARWLSRPGAVVIELAPHQADAAVAMALPCGATSVRVEPDLAGRQRVLVARYN